jgi:hypothetical protein
VHATGDAMDPATLPVDERFNGRRPTASKALDKLLVKHPSIQADP